MAKKTEQDRVANQTLPEKIKAFFKEFAIVFGAFLVLNSFVLASFEVPTGSMENEIMTGDFLLVNKFVFGGTTPRTIPFTNTKIPAFKLPSPWKVERGDVIVFIFPGNREEVTASEFAYYLKRCVALAGDTIRIIDKKVFINGEPAPLPRNVQFDLRHPIQPAGYANASIFPRGAPFNEDNYGPVVVPKEGDVITLNAQTIDAWGTFIKREGHTVGLRGGRVLVDGVEQSSYTVQRDYVFGMGDNRDNSLDSRFWGFIPEESVIGTPLVVYWSWNPEIQIWPLSTMINNLPSKLSTIRLGRIGNLVD
ncbi:MAG TPA: signal peptidase I [Bacteroidota bacterium]|jgi:signal peptidase I|nr:signal peptidase I [Bacteroidota bacterium]